MRDLIVTLIVFGSVPIILRRPAVGVLMWTWLSLMNPHRLTWGFAFDMPFAQAVGIALIVGLLISKEPKRIPWSPMTVVWLMFIAWMCVTTVFAIEPSISVVEWGRTMKIQLVAIITLMVMTTRRRLEAFVWMVAMSIAFFGIKGGVFTLATGGNFKVWGPSLSFIAGNNEIAFALIIVLPLLRFLQLQARNKWISRALAVSMLLCVASVIGSWSRGAFLALGMMGVFLVWKSRQRALMIGALIVLLPIGLSLLPQKYWWRMESIQYYEQDASAMGRINAWTFAVNLANDHPITGGGFGTFRRVLFKQYAPDPEDFHDVHSIYFEILGEHGYVGFLLFMLLAFLGWRAAGWTARAAERHPDATWHADLARMSQVCMVGYATGGAFLGLAYFDLYYNILGIIVLNRLLLERLLAEQQARQGTAAPSWHRPQPPARGGPQIAHRGGAP